MFQLNGFGWCRPDFDINAQFVESAPKSVLSQGDKVRDVTDIPDLDEEVETSNVVFLPVELFGDVDTMEADNVDVVITYRQPHEDGRYLRPQLKTMYIDVISSPLERKHRY